MRARSTGSVRTSAHLLNPKACDDEPVSWLCKGNGVGGGDHDQLVLADIRGRRRGHVGAGHVGGGHVSGFGGHQPGSNGGVSFGGIGFGGIAAGVGYVYGYPYPYGGYVYGYPYAYGGYGYGYPYVYGVYGYGYPYGTTISFPNLIP
jgi:hypothetical protein